MSSILNLMLCAAIFACMTSCYTMPGPDDFSTIPSTNNPAFTKEKPSASPNVGY